MLQSFNRRWRFLGGDTDMATDLTRSAGGFNRRWRFLGGDTWLMPQASWATPAVSIAGGDSWVGIHGSLMPVGTEGLVSIAGGDSWVGIRHRRHLLIDEQVSFNRRWRFLGGDTNFIGSEEVDYDGFNRRWRFLGGDTAVGKYEGTTTVLFQSQVAILGWGYYPS